MFKQTHTSYQIFDYNMDIYWEIFLQIKNKVFVFFQYNSYDSIGTSVKLFIKSGIWCFQWG